MRITKILKIFSPFFSIDVGKNVKIIKPFNLISGSEIEDLKGKTAVIADVDRENRLYKIRLFPVDNFTKAFPIPFSSVEETD